MNFYSIVILSKNKLTNLNPNYLQLDTSVELINQTTISNMNRIISFDYLIFNDINLINNFFNTNILYDERIPVTNYFGVTSIENILYTEKISTAILNIENNEI